MIKFYNKLYNVSVSVLVPYSLVERLSVLYKLIITMIILTHQGDIDIPNGFLNLPIECKNLPLGSKTDRVFEL